MRVSATALLVVACASGCVGLAGIRNGPARNRMRAKTHVTGVEWVGANTQRVSYVRDADVSDGSRPLGFGIGGKVGYAHGGTASEAHGGYAQDLNAYLVLAFSRFYVAPQIAFTMNIHGGGSGMTSTEESGGMALMLPLELEAGMRASDRSALYVAGGRSLWGAISAGGETEGASFWRGRAGALLVVREGNFEKKEITLRVEGFALTGSGTMLDYSAVGALLAFDFVFTTSGY